MVNLSEPKVAVDAHGELSTMASENRKNERLVMALRDRAKDFVLPVFVRSLRRWMPTRNAPSGVGGRPGVGRLAALPAGQPTTTEIFGWAILQTRAVGHSFICMTVILRKEFLILLRKIANVDDLNNPPADYLEQTLQSVLQQDPSPE